MKKVLIVEDEKMIRKGIKTMVSRSTVETGEILECKNGEEALDVLKEQAVDLVITDVRMPKMDGITLIKEIQKLPHIPKIVVVSGYDDFNYVVEVLRNGVKDYLLKPIEREVLHRILEEVEQEILEDEKTAVRYRQVEKEELKYLILNEQMDSSERARLEDGLNTELFNAPYVVCCNHCQTDSEDEGLMLIKNVEGHSLWILKGEKAEQLLKEKECLKYSGVSSIHNGLESLRTAYEEGVKAREYAFTTCKEQVHYSEIKETKESIDEGFSELFVHTFGTDKYETNLRKLETCFFQAKKNEVSTQSLLNTISDLLKKLLETYQNVIAMDMEGYKNLCQILSYKNADFYLEQLKSWLNHMKEVMNTEFEDYQNKEKINQAVLFIRENYKKNLNMAIVSNHISMNYSLFSLTFKQYTGTNFVSYLKMIRMNEAKRLLEETEEKIITISQLVGYDNEKHFMKSFKSICGISPTEYRKNAQGGKGI